MPNLILVHGAWHKAQVWDHLLPHLSDSIKAIPVEMPGRVPSSEKSYLQINLDSYVTCIEEVLLNLDEPSFLLGHSLAGLSISQVGQNHPDKIKGLIYLSAFVPADGESMLELTNAIENPGLKSELNFKPRQNRIDISPSEKTKHCLYNECAPSLADQAISQLNPEPFNAFSSQVFLSESFNHLDKYYIKAIKDESLAPKEQDNMIAKTNFNKVFELNVDHSPFFSNPELLSKTLQEIINR